MTSRIQFAVNAFAGIGGWEVHDEELGVRTDGLELNDAAVATARAAGRFTYRQDVSTYELFSGHIYHGLKTSPPCGPFTVAGAGAGRRMMADIIRALPQVTDRAVPYWIVGRHAEASLVLEPMRLIRRAFYLARPFRWIVMEQTREVLPVFEAYATELRAVGYSVAVGVVHAEQFEVPQTRTRAVLIASLDRDVTLPEPVCARYKSGQSLMDLYSTDRGTKPWVSMGKALRVGYPAEGAYLRSNYGTGGDASKRGRRTFWQPAPTITRKYNRNKWVLNGEVLAAMTDAEALTLQTFPEDYRYALRGGKTEIQLQIGNAIPPLLAKAILQQVL